VEVPAAGRERTIARARKTEVSHQVRCPVPQSHSLLDLQGVAESQRAITWRKAARSFFPGLTIRNLRGTPNAGSIERSEFSLGSIWTVLSPPAAVDYRPQADGTDVHQSFTVILQLQGAMAADQRHRHCNLQPGDMCLLDEQWPFDLEVQDCFSHFMLMRMPRWMIFDRYPHISEHTASLIYDEDPGATLLRQMLQHVHDIAPFLNAGQSDVAFAGILQLLGILRALDPKQDRGLGWRAHAALTLIDAKLADATLSASDIAAAQGIGRRHLDEIMLRNTGIPITAQIWRRRLEKTAADLRNPRFAAKSITQIAFDAGFKDAAHFARAFKKRYHCTPRKWRHMGFDATSAAAPPGRHWERRRSADETVD
jgi:AraC family transcriptional regulator, positive regulator of tynA and feaB